MISCSAAFWRRFANADLPHSIFLIKEDMRIIRIGDKVWPGWEIEELIV